MKQVTIKDIYFGKMDQESAVKTYNASGEQTGWFVKVNGVYKFWNI